MFLLLIIVFELLIKLLLLLEISNFIPLLLSEFLLLLFLMGEILFFSSFDLLISKLAFNKSFLNFFKFSFENILFALLIDTYNSSKIFLFSKNPIEFPLFNFFFIILFLIFAYFCSLSFSPISILNIFLELVSFSFSSSCLLILVKLFTKFLLSKILI